MIKVGLIGASPDRGWALAAHLPALRQLEDYEVVAVATSRPTTAIRAESVYGASRSYSSGMDLLGDPEVDLVVITVKVPYHHALVTAATSAGKNVLCEWPLGNGLHDAQEMLKQATHDRVRAFVGLQARGSPTLNFVRQLVADGYVGEVLGSSVVASGLGWGAAVDVDQIYLFDRDNGATMLSVAGGHLLDAIQFCLGSLSQVGAKMFQRREMVAVLDMADLTRYRAFTAHLAMPGEDPPLGLPAVSAREVRRSTVHDQIAITGVLQCGAFLSVHLRGGLSRSTNLLWEINGTAGDLRIESRLGSIQTQPLVLYGSHGQPELNELQVPHRFAQASLGELPTAASNVAYLYRMIAEDIEDGASKSPNFTTAVELHRLLDDVERAAGVSVASGGT